jgi:hypothetical protein
VARIRWASILLAALAALPGRSDEGIVWFLCEIERTSYSGFAEKLGWLGNKNIRFQIEVDYSAGTIDKAHDSSEGFFESGKISPDTIRFDAGYIASDVIPPFFDFTINRFTGEVTGRGFTASNKSRVLAEYEGACKPVNSGKRTENTSE